jgi:uncharacterized protein YdeI (BOF family)
MDQMKFVLVALIVLLLAPPALARSHGGHVGNHGHHGHSTRR